MKCFRLFVIAGLAFVLLTPFGSAHHSTNDIYDESRTVEIKGVVVAWRFVNPHPSLLVEVTTPEGAKQVWDLSFGGSAVAPLRRRGYSPETFKTGVVIVARGNPARTKDAYGILVRGGITLEDGTPVP